MVLLSHLLKWEYQPDRRSGSWRGTILEQQRELRQLLESGTLRNHATAVFADAYADARKQAAAETGLLESAFPEECGWDLDSALADWDEAAEPGAAADRPRDSGSARIASLPREPAAELRRSATTVIWLNFSTGSWCSTSNPPAGMVRPLRTGQRDHRGRHLHRGCAFSSASREAEHPRSSR